MAAKELEAYPLTGRFLMGRLRNELSKTEKRALESAIGGTEEFSRPHTIKSRGDLCETSTYLIEGFALRTIVEDGRRYVVGIQVPGDFVDLGGLALRRLDHDITTIGPVKLGYVTREKITEAAMAHTNLRRILWFSTLLDAAVHRQWILRLQQLTAARRVAHVFAELWYRLELVGLANKGGISTPLTQADLADMCGTTTIHMSRALGALRKDGIGSFRRGEFLTPDRRKLEGYAHFDPAYLYGSGELNN